MVTAVRLQVADRPAYVVYLFARLSAERGSLDDPQLPSESRKRCALSICFLRAHRLYGSSHPAVSRHSRSSLRRSAHSAASLDGLELRIERSGIVVPKLNEGHLPDIRGEFHSLAGDLQRSGIHSIFFSIKFHVGELDTLTHLITDALLKSEEAAKRFGAGGWPARLREHRVSGIHINTLTERNVDSVLASLIAALVAYGGNAPKMNPAMRRFAPRRSTRSQIPCASSVARLPLWKWPADFRPKMPRARFILHGKRHPGFSAHTCSAQ